MRSAFSINPSDWITFESYPGRHGQIVFENVDPCTTARSIRSKTLSKIHLRVSTAPTGTCPPDSDFDKSTMSGSIPQCSQARKRPVRLLEPGLHLIGDKQRAVFATQLERGAQVIARGHRDALALDRLDDEGCNCFEASARSSAATSLNGTSTQPGNSGPKPERKMSSPITDSEP